MPPQFGQLPQRMDLAKFMSDVQSAVDQGLLEVRKDLETKMKPVIDAKVKEAEEKAAATAREVHDLRIAKEESLYTEIKALKRVISVSLALSVLYRVQIFPYRVTCLQVKEEQLSKVLEINATQRTLLLYPTRGGKKEALLWVNK